jgi:hypothetical protein
MKFRAAVIWIAIALAVPALAQHGAVHGGAPSRSVSAGHTGYVGHSGFSGPGGISRPASPLGSGRSARPVFGRFSPLAHTGFRVPYQGRGFATRRSPYSPVFGNRFRGWGRDRRRGPWIVGSFRYGYPGWLGYPYPYVIDPGFYDWGDSGDTGSGYEQGGANPGYADTVPYAGDGVESETPQENGYTQAQPMNAPPRVNYAGSTASTPQAEEALTVVFNNGRAPATIRNYMMNAKALTDLDQQHYEQIPLDQIDIAATERANRARGLDFQVPNASR